MDPAARPQPATGQTRVAHARRASPDGKLRCQVPHCGFRFDDLYGPDAHGYNMHVHHLDPMRHGERFTQPDDLIVICSVCHAMTEYLDPQRPMSRLIYRDSDGRETS